jgi:hypothetical protein
LVIFAGQARDTSVVARLPRRGGSRSLCEAQPAGHPSPGRSSRLLPSWIAEAIALCAVRSPTAMAENDYLSQRTGLPKTQPGLDGFDDGVRNLSLLATMRNIRLPPTVRAGRPILSRPTSPGDNFRQAVAHARSSPASVFNGNSRRKACDVLRGITKLRVGSHVFKGRVRNRPSGRCALNLRHDCRRTPHS